MTIFITDDDIKRLLPMKECIEAMRVCFRDFAEGKAVNRPRQRYLADTQDPARKFFANVHAGASPSAGMACVRAGAVMVKPKSPTQKVREYDNPRPFNWGVVILFDIETAEPVALMHEFFLSGVRVGATTGLAVDEIAPPDASTMALFGTGKQALTNCEAILCVRPITRVNVYSPNAVHRESFAARMGNPPGVSFVPVTSPEAAIDGVDIIACASAVPEGVHCFDGNRLQPGQMVVTIVNSDVTRKRSEVDETTFARSDAIVINDWETVPDSGQVELLEPIEKGLVSRDRVIELGDLAAGRATVKQTPDNIIYYKNNTGLAIQFAAAGSAVYQKMIAEGSNRSIPTEWLGSDLSSYYADGFTPSM